MDCWQRLAEAPPVLRPNLLLVASDMDWLLPYDPVFNTVPAPPPVYGGLGDALRKLPGYLMKRAPWLPDAAASLLARLATRPRATRLLLPPGSTDVLLNTVLVPLKGLERYRGAVKLLRSGDCVNPSRFYTSIYAARARSYDAVLVAHRSCVEPYRRRGVEAILYPYFVNPLVHRRRPLGKRYDIVFIGRVTGERARLIGRLREALGADRVHVFSEWHRNMSRIYNMARIVLNVSRIGEVNKRVFEALGSGAFLLTDHTEELLEYFRPGVHLETYSGPEELVEKARRYLRDREEREAIAQRGYLEAWRRHTVFHRIFSMLEQLPRVAEPTPRLRELIGALPGLRRVLEDCIAAETRQALATWQAPP